jgi:AbrB family looped-hinge helix DNA binding protein
MDAAGRLVIPKEVRRAAGLKPGMPLEVRWSNGRIEIEPEPVPVKLIQKGRFLVAVPERDTGVLTPEMVQHTLQTLRDERGRTE